MKSRQSCRVLALEGAQRAADLSVIGDEDTLAAAVRRYFDAGATDVVFTQTEIAGEADRERTVRFLGTLRRDRLPAGSPQAGSADGKAFAQ